MRVSPGAQVRAIVPSTDPRLRQVCKPVERGVIIGPLVDEMFLAMNYPHGIGLAAPQIGEPLRVIVVAVPHGRDVIRHHVVNPVIVEQDNLDPVKAWEGCLSFPASIRFLVPRKRHIKVEGFDRNWEPIRFGARDAVARVLQHEIDHLDGITIEQRGERRDERKAGHGI